MAGREIKLLPGMTLEQWTALKQQADAEASAIEAAKDPRERARALAIAKEIARSEFEEAFHFTSAAPAKDPHAAPTESELAVKERERIAALLAARAKRTLKLIANPRHIQLYTTEGERQLLTDTKLETLLQGIAEGRMDFARDVRALGRELRAALTDALFGCEVYIGLCKDASGSSMDYVGAGDYTRRETKGIHVSFECFETRDVTVHFVSYPLHNAGVDAKKGPKRLQGGGGGGGAEGSGAAALHGGETVVYVPLLGKRGGVGVIEIHGLVTPGLTDLSQYRRNSNLIEAMIARQDFRFRDTVRLWRLPGQRIDRLAEAEARRLNVTHYHAVCGRIHEVNFADNGVPYVGGARYHIKWEDGHEEPAIAASDLLRLYRETPQSLGTGSLLDSALTEVLLRITTAAGELIEAQRTRDTLSLLKKRLHVASLGELESFDRTMDICLLLVRGSRLARLLVLDEAKMEAHCLSEREGAVKIQLQNVTKTDTQLALAALEQADPTAPVYLSEKGSHEWVCVELRVPSGYCWKHEPRQRRFVAAVLRTFNQFTAAGAVEVGFFVDCLATLSASLDIAWRKELRVRQRRDLFRSVEMLLFSSRTLSIQETCAKVLAAISPAVPGCSLYVGLLEEQATVIVFAAAVNSEMQGRVLRRGEGISFDCLESLETIQINAEDTNKAKFLQPGSSVQCLYGRRAYKGVIHAVRGHEKFDVRFLELDEKVEAGVDIARITPAHTAFRMKLLGRGPIALPFVVMPVRNLAKGLGVLGIDSIMQLPRAPYDPVPEPPLLLFLQQIGRLLGAHIDGQCKRLALKGIIKVRVDCPLCSSRPHCVPSLALISNQPSQRHPNPPNVNPSTPRRHRCLATATRAWRTSWTPPSRASSTCCPTRTRCWPSGSCTRRTSLTGACEWCGGWGDRWAAVAVAVAVAAAVAAVRMLLLVPVLLLLLLLAAARQ